MGTFIKDHKSPWGLYRINPAKTSHISLKDCNTCRQCRDKPCTFYCPTGVYSWNEVLKIDYPRCIECGACPYGCPFHNICWEYPEGGFGVVYGQLTANKLQGR